MKFLHLRWLASVLRVKRRTLKMAACKYKLPATFSYSDSSRVILDARLGFQIKRGYAITFLYATDEALAKWKKIVLPYSAGLERRVADIEALSTKIGFNFTFEAPPEITDR